VKFVDFNRGDTTGFVRFAAAGGATAALAALNASPEAVGGATPVWRLLAPEEEDAYKKAVRDRARESEREGEREICM